MTQQALKLALDKKAENARELGLDYEPENTLHWHALNYRTAPTQNAQAMFEALEKFVETAIKEALKEHAMREVQRLGQEPVAWEQFYPDIGKPQIEFAPVKIVAYNCTCGRTMNFESVHGVVAPQRTWVGLTDEEIKKMRHLIDWTAGWSYNTFARAIEAKLKELNT